MENLLLIKMNRFDKYVHMNTELPQFRPNLDAIDKLLESKQKQYNQFDDETDLVAASIKASPMDSQAKVAMLQDIEAKKESVKKALIADPKQGQQSLANFQKELKNRMLFGDINKMTNRYADYQTRMNDLKTAKFKDNPHWMELAKDEIEKSYGDFYNQDQNSLGLDSGQNFNHTYYTDPEKDLMAAEMTKNAEKQVIADMLKDAPIKPDPLSYDAFVKQLKTQDIFKSSVYAKLKAGIQNNADLKDYFETHGKALLGEEGHGNLSFDDQTSDFNDDSLMGQWGNAQVSKYTVHNTEQDLVHINEGVRAANDQFYNSLRLKALDRAEQQSTNPLEVRPQSIQTKVNAVDEHLRQLEVKKAEAQKKLGENKRYNELVQKQTDAIHGKGKITPEEQAEMTGYTKEYQALDAAQKQSLLVMQKAAGEYVFSGDALNGNKSGQGKGHAGYDLKELETDRSIKQALPPNTGLREFLFKQAAMGTPYEEVAKKLHLDEGMLGVDDWLINSKENALKVIYKSVLKNKEKGLAYVPLNQTQGQIGLKAIDDNESTAKGIETDVVTGLATGGNTIGEQKGADYLQTVVPDGAKNVVITGFKNPYIVPNDRGFITGNIEYNYIDEKGKTQKGQTSATVKLNSGDHSAINRVHDVSRSLAKKDPTLLSAYARQNVVNTMENDLIMLRGLKAADIDEQPFGYTPMPMNPDGTFNTVYQQKNVKIFRNSDDKGYSVSYQGELLPIHFTTPMDVLQYLEEQNLKSN